MKVAHNSNPKTVVQNPARCDNMPNAIGLLTLISQGEEDIRQGRSREQEDVFRDIESFQIEAPGKKRRPGSAKGLLSLVSEDDEHLNDFKEYMP